MERQRSRCAALLLAGSLGARAGRVPRPGRSTTADRDPGAQGARGREARRWRSPTSTASWRSPRRTTAGSAAKGQYLSTRSAAETFIKTRSPHYGILSLAAFLALREKYQMEVIGRVASPLAGGEQYFIVSKTATRSRGLQGPQAGERSLRRHALRRAGGRARRVQARGFQARQEPASAPEPAAGAERRGGLRAARRRPARGAQAPRRAATT